MCSKCNRFASLMIVLFRFITVACKQSVLVRGIFASSTRTLLARRALHSAVAAAAADVMLAFIPPHPHQCSRCLLLIRYLDAVSATDDARSIFTAGR